MRGKKMKIIRNILALATAIASFFGIYFGLFRDWPFGTTYPEATLYNISLMLAIVSLFSLTMIAAKIAEDEYH